MCEYYKKRIGVSEEAVCVDCRGGGGGKGSPVRMPGQGKIQKDLWDHGVGRFVR